VSRQRDDTSTVTGEAAVRDPVKIYCSWSATRYPQYIELDCPKEKFSYIRGTFTAAQGTAINFTKMVNFVCNFLLVVREFWMLG
jgi:hypothetical protein